MLVRIQKLDPRARIPSRGSAQAAAYDLYAGLPAPELTIAPHTNCRGGTGPAIAVPEGYFGAIFARSGLAAKQGLRPANCVGVADSDYRGEYMVALYNDSDEPRTVHDGDRIAQLVVLPYLNIEFEEAEALEDTARGAGGFGSTGVQ